MTTMKKRKGAIQKAYTKLAQRHQNWPNKYNSRLQLSKMLCDYALPSNVSLLNKRILKGCSEPVDEVRWVSLVKE